MTKDVADSKPKKKPTSKPNPQTPTPAAGDTIRFASNTWRVLAINTTDLLVLSDTLVADKLFADTPSNTYATSTIRTWLTGDYLSTAFTPAEQTALKPTSLPDVDITADKVFLLSAAEVSDLLEDPSASSAWWLRTPDAYNPSYINALNPDGTLTFAEANTHPLAVRPALTLDTTKLELSLIKKGSFTASPSP
jgi:hypothetical protein